MVIGYSVRKRVRGPASSNTANNMIAVPRGNQTKHGLQACGHTLRVHLTDAVGTCHRQRQMGSDLVDSGKSAARSNCELRRSARKPQNALAPPEGGAKLSSESGRIVHKSVKKSPLKLRGKHAEIAESAVETESPLAHCLARADSVRKCRGSRKTVPPGAFRECGSAFRLR